MRRRTALASAAAAMAATLALLAAGLTAGSSTAAAAGLTARNLPADGKILPVMGQDSDTLSDYKTQVLDNASLNAPAPGGVTLYTNLVEGGSPAPLAGMFSPANWGSGTVDFGTTTVQYPGGLPAHRLRVRRPVELLQHRLLPLVLAGVPPFGAGWRPSLGEVRSAGVRWACAVRVRRAVSGSRCTA